MPVVAVENVVFNKKRLTPTLGIVKQELERPGVLPDISRVSVESKGRPSDGNDGYSIKRDGGEVRIISATDIGALYAAYHMIRLGESGREIPESIEESPFYDLRILNHWDNLDGTIERGYAGRSLWKWDELPGMLSPRYAEYARRNAMVGINATVLNLSLIHISEPTRPY